MIAIDDGREWIEPDGAGGFASGTAAGVRTRRYHAVLLTATTPPTGRMVLVNGVEVWATTPAGRWALSTQCYQPGVVHPDGHTRIVSFASDPWPTWEFALPDGTRLAHELLVDRTGAAVLAWRVLSANSVVALELRPLLSGRDYHSLHHENGSFRFDVVVEGDALVWHPYDGVPGVRAHGNGRYTSSPEWYRNFLYVAEQERGLDDAEDLASPGVFSWTLTSAQHEAILILDAATLPKPAGDAETRARRARAAEHGRRAAFPTLLDRAADAYVVRRGRGQTIVAGYPWFTDWGRDTFIALRGLCLATGRLDEARAILVEWAEVVSEGMLPNRFPDAGDAPEFNAVDAALWYVIAVHDLLERADQSPDIVSREDRKRLEGAVLAIVEGYAAGTRYGIRADCDGLLAAGETGVQLTWMDARVGDRVITPRSGKPVEVQALWLNALWIASAFDTRWAEVFERGVQAFGDRFWNPERSCLYDVVDVDHVPATVDATVRPNQILAIGGLPRMLLEPARARQIVDVVERELLTPFGLRSLARVEPGYAQRYQGGPDDRDAVYHQGTVWPWLIGPFVDAWIRVHGDDAAARRTARAAFVTPLVNHVIATGGGHLCEITDAEEPFRPRGCPFQAWSLGELLRIERATREARTDPAPHHPSKLVCS
jgi:predicted glycogen debranching enzyme